MQGFVRIGFAAASAFLRLLAWLPLNVGWGLSELADWCELRTHE